MSIVTLQIGQCGNQIGEEFFNTITKDISSANIKSANTQIEVCYAQDSRERFFRCEESKHYDARAILIDTEPKVVNSVIKKAKREGSFGYSSGNVYLQSRGSANNWAYGFYQHGRTAMDDIINLCRVELERCDRVDGFLLMMSSAGGTGSGLGTRITSELCDSFPKKSIVSQVVLPHESGEVVLQDYNTMLSLCHLYQSSDGIGVFQNDRLFNICKNSLSHRQHQVALNDLNKIIANQLCSVLQPNLDHGVPGCGGAARWSSTMADLVECLCSCPLYKLMSITNSPCSSKTSLEYDSFLWSGLLKDLRQNSSDISSTAVQAQKPDIAQLLSLEPSLYQRSKKLANKSFANLVVLRGTDLHQADIACYFPMSIYSNRNKRNCLTTWKQSRPLLRHNKYAALVSNDQSHVQSLNRIVSNAWRMFSSRAYLHQYLQCGFTEDDFLHSFAAVEQIVHDYCYL